MRRENQSRQPFVIPDRQALSEQDFRMTILNSFLFTPHGDLTQLKDVHDTLLSRDPIFYGHLAAWYMRKGTVRDHKELFTAHLFTSEDSAHREAAFAFLQDFPPYEVARIIDYCSRQLNKKPRILVTAVKYYLRAREKDDNFFDRAVMRAREPMKHLYASLRIKPCERAQKILFEDDPPKSSVLHKVKILSKSDDPQMQAKIILDGKIPFPVAIGALRRVTPSLLIPLISSMSAQELLNCLSFLKRRGALRDPAVSRLINEKLDQAKTATRLDAYKAKIALDQVEASGEIEEKLEDLRMHQLGARGKIRRPTAILIDKSKSMERAIEAGKRIASLCSGIAEGPLHVYLFDSMVYEVIAEARELREWEREFAPVSAGGNTSIGAALAVMRKKKVAAEQIIIVSDTIENTPPFFLEEYEKYAKDLLCSPSVIIVKIPGTFRGRASLKFESSLSSAGIEYQTFEFQGDYYSLPNLIPLLTYPTRAELLMEVMETPLPARPLS